MIQFCDVSIEPLERKIVRFRLLRIVSLRRNLIRRLVLFYGVYKFMKRYKDEIARISVIFTNAVGRNDVLRDEDELSLFTCFLGDSISITVCSTYECNLVFPFIENFPGYALDQCVLEPIICPCAALKHSIEVRTVYHPRSIKLLRVRHCVPLTQ